MATPVRQDVPIYAYYTGSTQAVARVEVRARVKGILLRRLFTEGKTVAKGQTLFVIDDDPYKVQHNQAKAKLEEAKAALEKAEQSRAPDVAESQLAVDEAQLRLSELDEKRNQALYNRKASSGEELDKAEATRKKTTAQRDADRANRDQIKADYRINIESARAGYEAARTALRAAEIDLDYCTIKAPITGRISKSEVDEGNLVGDGQATLLATIHQIDRIYAYVYASEEDILRARGKPGETATTPTALELGLVNEEGFPHRGEVNYTDPSVDPATGTIRTRGVFNNPDGTILPGLFVRVRGKVGDRPDALLVPGSALGHDQQGDYLLVVNANNVVERRAIRPGEAVESLRVVEGEIGPDDQVIVAGLQRARSGFPVTPKPQGQPAAGGVAAESRTSTTGRADPNQEPGQSSR